MTTLQHIKTLQEPPIVGRSYLVDCAQAIPDWLPLLGEPHEDPEAGLGHSLHQHIDVRFLTAQQLQQNFSEPDPQSVMDVILSPEFLRGRSIETRERICQREMPMFPLLRDRTAELMEKLEGIYCDRRVDDCLRCPHKRINLADVPIVGGGRICPGHGLKWRASDGKLMLRTRQKQSTSSRGVGFG